MSVAHHPFAALQRPKRGLRRIIAAIGTWRSRSRGRECLLRLNDRELKDLGISRYDAECEARKPFWRV
jgi:uncharacterized protein YjiS (DUF1127 family)